MFAETLISHELFPLKKTDTCGSAIVFMHDWGVSELPVVENNIVLGYVSIDEIGNNSINKKVDLFIKNDKQIFALAQQHIFEVIKIFDESGLSTVSVLDNENHFLGIISFKEVFKNINKHSTLSQAGGIITLEMLAKDYSLSELARIVEYNDVNILNVYINSSSDEGNTILVSLKFNHTELKNVIASLQRHGKIIRSINLAESNEEASFSNRYDWLIKYLNT